MQDFYPPISLTDSDFAVITQAPTLAPTPVPTVTPTVRAHAHFGHPTVQATPAKPPKAPIAVSLGRVGRSRFALAAKEWITGGPWGLGCL